MIMRTSSVLIVGLLAGNAAFADDHSQTTIYALTGNGSSLLTLDDVTQTANSQSYTLSEALDAIAYRPVTGDLLGFSTAGEIYNVDTTSGELTSLKALFAEEAVIAPGAVAFDFNNAIDAARLVGAAGTNLVYFPDEFGDERANQVLKFTDAFYGEGDVNEGVDPFIFANAYTNAIVGNKAESTFQYALDARTDALVSLANNAGTLATVGGITIDGQPADVLSAGGFDIVSPEAGMDKAYAILQLEGSDTSGVYSIDLETAAATLISDLGVTDIVGFAAK